MQTPIQQRPLCVLVVDDHVDTAVIMTKLITRSRFTAVSAYSIGEALAVANKTPIDLLFCDIDLPDGSGYEVLTTLRLTRPGLPATALTGYCTELDLQQHKEVGFGWCLKKPFNLKEMLEILEEMAAAANE